MPILDELTTLRRFLRDPDSAVWSNDDLLVCWNDAQAEIQQKTGLLERVETHYYPPRYTTAHLFSWEEGFCEGDKFQALQLAEPTGWVISYTWEIAYWLETMDVQDGYRFTQPWESVYCDPADSVPIPLDAQFYRMKYAAYNREAITPIEAREVSADRFFRSRTGFVTNYFRPDERTNELILYPKPSTVVWQDTAETDVLDDSGGLIASSEGYMDFRDTGLTTDVIDSEDALFVHFEATPQDVDNWADSDCDFPDWMLKYIRYGALERAYSADTDGFIPSLRDFWRQRKEIGIKALLKLKRLRMTGVEYRIGGPTQQGARSRMGALPEGYPAI